MAPLLSPAPPGSRAGTGDELRTPPQGAAWTEGLRQCPRAVTGGTGVEDSGLACEPAGL